MRLNYAPPMQQPAQQQTAQPMQTAQQIPPQTQQPANEDIGYFSPKTSDKYSTFINMQQVANAALGKNGNISEKLQDVNPLQPANKGDRYDV